MSDPDTLSLDFEVRAPVAHAFRTWVERAGLWWPPSHTVTGDPASVTFERGQGGRIVEVARDGAEHVWGHITHWDEPREIGFVWVHVFDPSQATHVTLTFASEGPSTRIRLEQRGFAALGVAGEVRRARTGTAWGVVMSSYAAVVEAGQSAG